MHKSEKAKHTPKKIEEERKILSEGGQKGMFNTTDREEDRDLALKRKKREKK